MARGGVLCAQRALSVRGSVGSVRASVLSEQRDHTPLLVKRKIAVHHQYSQLRYDYVTVVRSTVQLYIQVYLQLYTAVSTDRVITHTAIPTSHISTSSSQLSSPHLLSTRCRPQRSTSICGFGVACLACVALRCPALPCLALAFVLCVPVGMS